MRRYSWLFTGVICTVLLLWTANAYSFNFGNSQKADSVADYDKAHDLYLKGDYADAAKGYEEFMKNYPDSLLVEGALYYAAKCYTEQKDYDKAISYYKQLIDKYKEGFWVDSAKDEIVKIQAIKKGE